MNSQRTFHFKPQNALWFLGSLVIPGIFVLFVAFYLLPRTHFPSYLGIPVATAWGLMGGVIHFMSLKRGSRFRWRGYALHAGFSLVMAIAAVALFPQVAAPTMACPVCGFVALEEAGDECPVCGVTFTEVEATMEGFSSLQEFLTAEQMIYFQPTKGDTVVDFFAPCNCPGAYPKEKGWQPSVTKADVLEVSEMVRK